MFALRGRYHPTQWRKLPSIFPQGFSGPVNRDALGDRIGFGIRLVAFSTAGLIVGQSCGFALGTWRSSQLLRREGNFENIQRVMNKVKDDIERDAQQRRGGQPVDGLETPPIPYGQRKRLQGQSGALDQPSEQGDLSGLSSDSDFYGRNRRDALQNSRLSRTFEKDGPGTRTRDKAWDEAPFVDERSSSGLAPPDFGASFPSTSGRPTDDKPREPAGELSQGE